MKYLFFAALLYGFYYWVKQKPILQAKMSVESAAKLLGIAQNADIETINEAHKRLITKVHPDTGGSAELAAQVNQARDILLRARTL